MISRKVVAFFEILRINFLRTTVMLMGVAFFVMVLQNNDFYMPFLNVTPFTFISSASECAYLG